MNDGKTSREHSNKRLKNVPGSIKIIITITVK
jgi:hypothetical protein